MIYTKQQWYTPSEVVIHNTAKDCWVSLNGRVLDLTDWLAEQFRLCTCRKNCSCVIKNWYCADDCVEYCPCFKRGFPYCDKKRLAMTILAYAGKDISHWFRGDEWVRYTHPVTGAAAARRPHGLGTREPQVPSTKWRPYTKPWWLDDSLVVGKLTANTRPIRITNTLTSSTVTLEVCSEETVYEVMQRYRRHNTHLASYSWRHRGRRLCLRHTLAENGIPDERDRFSKVLLPENIHVPAILIYYNDDLTEEPAVDDCFCRDADCIKDKPEPYILL
ncbi:cytochrome b5 domain-containing protein 1 [Cydia amplana]|uniref:cytochrome b5 domain-containing protein 1 n=1 Tax=Cydia amplana TaxID=1869771 RepID=UPI002FE5E678